MRRLGLGLGITNMRRSGAGGATLTLRQQIEGLRTQVTPNGRTSTNTLKVFGVDTPPAGITVSATTVTISTYTGDLEDWDFAGRGLVVNASMGSIRQCILSQVTTAHPLFWLVQIAANGRVAAFEYCTFNGLAGNPDGVGTAINQYVNAGGTVYGYLGAVRFCRFTGFASDHIKFCGDLAGDQIFEWNYHGSPHNLPYQPPMWLAGVTYAAGDYVYSPTSGTAFVYRSLSSGNTGNTPPTTLVDNAFWENVDPHADTFTSVAAINDVYIRFSCIDWLLDPPGAIGATVAIGINNSIRLSRNTGTSYLLEKIRVQENVVYHEPTSGAYGIQVSDGGQPNFNGPIEFVDNWFGANLYGSYYHPSTNGLVDIWTNNRDTLTDALITSPTIRERVNPYVLLDSYDALASRTITAPGAVSVVAPVVEGTGSIMTEQKGTQISSLSNPDISVGEAPTAWDLIAVMIDFGAGSMENSMGAVRPTITTGGIAYAYQVDTTVATVGLPGFGLDNGRGKWWKSFKASRLRQTNWAGAQLPAAGAAAKSTALQFQQNANGDYNSVVRVDAMIRPDRHKPCVMITCDDVNALQRTELADLLQARSLVATGYMAMDLLNTSTKLTTAQALELKNTYGWAWCLDSGPIDEPMIGFPTVSAAIAQLNAHRDDLIASGLGGAADAVHVCYSYGSMGYRSKPVTISCTATGTDTLTGVNFWGSNVCAGLVVKGTGLGSDPVVVNTPDNSTVVLSAAVPGGVYSLTFCGYDLGLATTCNGTTSVTVATAGLFVGQTMTGRDVPANTTITVLGSGVVTVSNAVPATCARASFHHLSGEFAFNKIEDAMMAAGYKTGRRVNTFVNGVYTGYGLDPYRAIGLPAYSMDGGSSNSARTIADIQECIDNATDMVGYLHYSASNVAYITAVGDFLQARVLAGDCDVMTIPQWWSAVSARGVLVP